MILALSLPVSAAENGGAQSPTQSYFSALPDIPLMAGMDEVQDQTYVFDKAEGRVVGTAGFLSHKVNADPLKFYSNTLEALGWKPLKHGVFTRNDEQLSVTTEKLSGGVLVRLQLSPHHP